MASTQQVKDALRRAAEAAAGRQLSETDVATLYSAFDAAQGTYFEKAITAISSVTQTSERLLLAKRAASDNTDKTFQDLKDALDNWKP